MRDMFSLKVLFLLYKEYLLAAKTFLIFPGEVLDGAFTAICASLESETDYNYASDIRMSSETTRVIGIYSMIALILTSSLVSCTLNQVYGAFYTIADVVFMRGRVIRSILTVKRLIMTKK